MAITVRPAGVRKTKSSAGSAGFVVTRFPAASRTPFSSIASAGLFGAMKGFCGVFRIACANVYDDDRGCGVQESCPPGHGSWAGTR